MGHATLQAPHPQVIFSRGLTEELVSWPIDFREECLVFGRPGAECPTGILSFSSFVFWGFFGTCFFGFVVFLFLTKHFGFFY